MTGLICKMLTVTLAASLLANIVAIRQLRKARVSATVALEASRASATMAELMLETMGASHDAIARERVDLARKIEALHSKYNDACEAIDSAPVGDIVKNFCKLMR